MEKSPHFERGPLPSFQLDISPATGQASGSLESPNEADAQPVSLWQQWTRQKLEELAKACGASTVDHSNSLSHETDVMLVVGNASKKAHRCVLEVRCPTIFAINVKRKTFKKGLVTIEMADKRTTIGAVERLLYYIYSGNIIRLFGMNLEETTELMFLAKTYEVWSLLKVLEWFMYISLGTDNWFHILKLSKHNKVDEAVDVCKLFAVHHFKEILPVGINALGLDIFYEITNHVIMHPQDFQLPSIDEIAAQINFDVARDFKKILHEKIRADTTFHINSEKLLCHSFIILGQSEKLSELFAIGTENVELPTAYSDITFGTFDACIKFLYYRDTDAIDAFVAYQLRKFSIDFGLFQLADTCSKVINKSFKKRNLLSTLGISIAARTKWGTNLASDHLDNTCLTQIFSSFSTFDFTKTTDPDVLLYLLSCAQGKVRLGEWVKKKDGVPRPRSRMGSKLEMRGSLLDVSSRGNSLSEIKLPRYNSVLLKRRKVSEALLIEAEKEKAREEQEQKEKEKEKNENESSLKPSNSSTGELGNRLRGGNSDPNDMKKERSRSKDKGKHPERRGRSQEKKEKEIEKDDGHHSGRPKSQSKTLSSIVMFGSPAKVRKHQKTDVNVNDKTFKEVHKEREDKEEIVVYKQAKDNDEEELIKREMEELSRKLDENKDKEITKVEKEEKGKTDDGTAKNERSEEEEKVKTTKWLTKSTDTDDDEEEHKTNNT